jgi:GT2 family glycosyltransferase
MTPDLTVSIVLYRTPLEHIQQCLSSLENYTGLLHVFVLDNSPTDELRGRYSTTLPTRYIHLPLNPGFGRAHNVAIREGQALSCPYHLVINADVSFNTDVLSPMLAYLDQHDNVGHMMPLVLNPDGSPQRLCKLVPSPADLLFRRFGRKETLKLRNSRFELHDSGYDKVMFVPYLSGCFMLLRQRALMDVGLFDERFFMYPEDIDLTRRLAENYQTIFYPHVSVVHEHGAASYKSFKMLLVHMLNIFKYFNKWGWLRDPRRKMLNEKTLAQF